MIETKRAEKVPSYWLCKRSGRAGVTLTDPTAGRLQVYLGKHGTAESWERYHRVIREWLANGRRIPGKLRDRGRGLDEGPLVADVLVEFWRHAEVYYRKPDGSPASELSNYRQALRPLRKLYSTLPAAQFDSVALEILRREMIGYGWVRTNINKQISRIRKVFKWAAAKKLVPASVWHELQAVDGLKRWRSEAKESEPVRPAPAAFIEAVRPYVSRQVWAIIELQHYTGARPGEVTALRAIDLDTSGKVWCVKPEAHKTAHHGHKRVIWIGPRAQKVIEPFLAGRAVDAPLFSALEAEAERRGELNAARKTPLSCGNRPGTNRSAEPGRRINPAYTVVSYRRAIERACAQVFPPPAELARQQVPATGRRKVLRWETAKEWRLRLGPERWAQLKVWEKAHRWHPHQLRHNAATYIRKEFGLEAAQAVLGHRMGSLITEKYAEEQQSKAQDVMLKVG